jgi:hypothetical protein
MPRSARVAMTGINGFTLFIIIKESIIELTYSSKISPTLFAKREFLNLQTARHSQSCAQSEEGEGGI